MVLLNAARLTASSLLFAATPPMLLGLRPKPRRYSLAVPQANPARLPLPAAADWCLAGTWNVVDELN